MRSITVVAALLLLGCGDLEGGHELAEVDCESLGTFSSDVTVHPPEFAGELWCVVADTDLGTVSLRCEDPDNEYVSIRLPDGLPAQIQVGREVRFTRARSGPALFGHRDEGSLRGVDDGSVLVAWGRLYPRLDPALVSPFEVHSLGGYCSPATSCGHNYGRIAVHAPDGSSLVLSHGNRGTLADCTVVAEVEISTQDSCPGGEGNATDVAFALSCAG